MPFIVSYLLKLSITLAAVWCVYWFLLRHLTFYTWNRYFLLIYSLLGFLIPFIDIASLIQQHEMSATMVMSSIPPLFVQNDVAAAATSANDYWVWSLYVFAAGMVWMLVRLLVQYISLYRIRRGATLLHAEGLKLYHVDEHIMPFSFGDAIYVNQHLHKEEELREIIHHEFIHVKQKHSVDIVFGELLCMLNWYNPFAWLLRKAIRQNLEFIADSAVLSNGMDRKAYQYLLLKVTGATQFSIANNFNFSSLKKRIAMMNKQKSAKVNLIRFLFMLPVISIVVLAFRGQGDPGKESFRYTYIQDTVPAAPKPPAPPKPHSFPDGVIRMHIKDGKATVKLANGKVENYDLTTTEGKASFESKYGEVIEAPEPPRVASVVTAQGRRIPPTVVHQGIQKDYRDFLRRNDDVENVQWKGDPLKIIITLQNGSQEVYNTEDKEDMRKAEAKYGKLPVPPPPPPAPPTPPKPPRPTTAVMQADGSAMVVDVEGEPVVAQGYRAAAREMAIVATPVTGQGIAQEPVVVNGYRASKNAVTAVQSAPSQTAVIHAPEGVRGYQIEPSGVVVASGRPSARKVTGVTGVTSSEIMADEIIIQPDGMVQAGKFDLTMIAKFTENSTQSEIDQVTADLLEQGYKFTVEKAEFEDGKLVRLRATISKGKDKSSFDASDFKMLMISIQTKNGKSGIHVHINNGKITV